MPDFYSGSQMWSPYQMPGMYGPTATPSSTYFNPDTGRMQFTPYVAAPAMAPAPVSTPAMGGMPAGGDFFAALAGLLGGGMGGAPAAPTSGRGMFPAGSMLRMMQEGEAARAKMAADNAAKMREVQSPKVGGPGYRAPERPTRQPVASRQPTSTGNTAGTTQTQHSGGITANPMAGGGSSKNQFQVTEGTGRGSMASETFGRPSRAPGLTPSSNYRRPQRPSRDMAENYGFFR
jgi:hypothetical protein